MKSTKKRSSFSMQETDEAEEENEDLSDRQKQIREGGAVITKNRKHTIQCLTVIGQIEGHYVAPSQNKTTKYEHVIPQIVSVEEDPNIDGLLMILNTVGGDVEAGLAIAELVAGMRKPTVSLVLGAPARRCDLNLMQLRHTYSLFPPAVVSVGSFTFLSDASFLSLKNKYHTANKIAPTTTQQSAKLNTYGKNSTWM